MTAGELMRAALEEAALALAGGEVAVGAVIERGGRIIARAHNRCEQGKNAALHAEMLALEMASQAKGDWRLNDCTLAVTLEPCLMCAGAIWNARVGRVVFGAFDPVRGGFGGAFDLRAVSGVQAVGGVLEKECLALLKKSWNR